MGGKHSGAGRTVVLASCLLGGPSGSGVATTVTLGSVAYPMLAKAGYGKDAAGGLLAAGGLGAILSPPVLGAAAFLIAEFLKISYLDVIWMATIPTCLYYLSLLFMVELDAKRFGAGVVPYDTSLSLGQMMRRYGFHFTSLIAVIVFMIIGYSPMLAVFYSTLLCFLFSAMTPETSFCPRQLLLPLLIVATAGMALFAGRLLGTCLLLTALYTALIVWIVGLAVPVTASYIICAVIAAPALTKLGVPDFAAHMFIFYYAVLSEVSPPTALSPFAAAAITGGDPYRTTLQAWKYTLPAFLVPFVFVLDPQGIGLLMKIPPGGSWVDVVVITLKTAAGLAALAAAAQNWALRKNTATERVLWVIAGLLLVFPSLLEAMAERLSGYDVPHPAPFGLVLMAAVLVRQYMTRSGPAPAVTA